MATDKRRMLPRQMPLRWASGWGGRRDGAGRKSGRGGVPHAARPLHKSRFPLHVTVRVRTGLPSLRSQSLCQCVVRQIRQARERFLRIVHYSVQSNHVHFIIEAADRRYLGRGMKGLGVRLARRINSLLSSKGNVLAERYHARALTTPREVRHALVYVLFNRTKHGGAGQGHRYRFVGGLDPCTSAKYFDGWEHDVHPTGWPWPFAVARARGSPEDWPVVSATTWLVVHGWKRLGLLRREERPRAE